MSRIITKVGKNWQSGNGQVRNLSAPGKGIPGAETLLMIAAKLRESARQAEDRHRGNFERYAPILLADQDDMSAMVKGILLLAKDFNGAVVGFSEDFYILNLALWSASEMLWEALWNHRHPDQKGKAWEGEDFDLMKVWRSRVKALFVESHQDAVLNLTADNYIAKLVESGAEKTDAIDMAGRLSVLIEEEAGDTGS